MTSLSALVAHWGSRTRATGLTWDSMRLVDAAAEDRLALDPLLGEVGDGMLRPGRPELAASMRVSSVVVRLVLSQDSPQVPFAEDRHPVSHSVRSATIRDLWKDL